MSTKYYDAEFDPEALNNSHALMVALVGTGQRVLDAGCATGYLARELVERGNHVSGVEYDPAAAEQAQPHVERLVVGDLLTLDLVAEFGRQAFDVVVLGDVLEHLAEPVRVLAQMRTLLAPGGSVVISVPNVAHGSVRLSLLSGRFDYTPTGLLDDTHVRFFTRAGLHRLVRDAGFVADEVHRTTFDFFGTEMQLRPENFDPALIEALRADEDAATYQFVIRVIPADEAADPAKQSRLIDEAVARSREFATRLALIGQELPRERARVEAAEARAESAEDQLAAIQNTKTFRMLQGPRDLYSWIRRAGR